MNITDYERKYDMEDCNGPGEQPEEVSIADIIVFEWATEDLSKWTIEGNRDHNMKTTALLFDGYDMGYKTATNKSQVEIEELKNLLEEQSDNFQKERKTRAWELSKKQEEIEELKETISICHETNERVRSRIKELEQQIESMKK